MTNPLAGLFKARQRDAARPDPLARSMRLCGEHLAEQAGTATPRHARLTKAIGVLTTSLATPSADSFDALLQVGQRALEAGDESALQLALGVAESSTELRQRSKGAWRLRGLALDGLGRGDEAVESYERFLALQSDHGAAADVVRRVDTLRRRRDCLDEAAGLFPEDDCPLRDSAGWPTSRTAPEFAAYVRAKVSEHGMGDPSVRRLIDLYAVYRRLVERGRTADPLLGGATPIDVSGLRGLLAGRTVCVVSDAEEPTAISPDPALDAYDLVVRCDSAGVRDQGTGVRTDLHAVTLRGAAPWAAPAWTRPAGIRLVFGDAAGAWRRAIRQRLVPGAQDHVGDASLRRPLSDPALLGEDGWDTRTTTTAFTTLRLLDFLDVSPRLDLIGFGLPGHLPPEEAEWVMDRATHIDDSKMRIALR
ncbi:hypothetical protein ACH5AL_07825 [Actinacidiphila glaucinigra]|uniref:hypothetical protein n=1 Tax=Actinacidiphila glaucinigra TaxID=235986 RepID=UPI0037949857